MSLLLDRTMENQGNSLEFVNGTLHRKEKTATITMLVSRNTQEGENKLEGINNAHRSINEIMNAWKDRHMVENMMNEKEEIMNRDQNWVIGERIIGIKNKRVDFFYQSNKQRKFL